MTSMHLQVAPLQNPERYPLLAQALTDLAERWLGAARETVMVLIDDLPAARWYVAGHPVERPAALLQVCLPAGQAGEGPRAEFTAQALKVLQRQLGHGEALAVGSGVMLREVPSTHWGRSEAPVRQAHGVA